MNFQSGFSHLSEALGVIQAKKKGLSFPPFIPREICAPLPKLCQLACVWQMAGEEKAAAQLAHRILQFAWENPPFSLWCREEEYDEDEGFFSLAWLCRVAGEQKKAETYFKRVKGPVSPFLKELASLDLSICPQEGKPEEEALLFEEGIFTLKGKGTSLGILRKGEVEIRAMGPQTLPLSGTEGFGIGYGERDWVCCQAKPDVWLEAKIKNNQVDLKFVGLKAGEPIGFSFYVKAESCQVGSEILKPKSLRRFQGLATTFHFQTNESNLILESMSPHKVQIIPLAGDKSFWNSEFLISFEIHPLNAQLSFLIK